MSTELAPPVAVAADGADDAAKPAKKKKDKGKPKNKIPTPEEIAERKAVRVSLPPRLPVSTLIAPPQPLKLV